MKCWHNDPFLASRLTSEAGDCVWRVLQKGIEKCAQAYLPGRGVNRDQLGGSPRARPYHCTTVGLTLAIAPNVGDSTVQFMCVGSAFALTLYKQTKVRIHRHPSPFALVGHKYLQLTYKH